MSISFRLLTPDRTLRDESVRSVTLPTARGEITVLPHHAGLVALLVPGLVRVQRESETEEIAISGGFIEVKEGNNGITLLADTAEHAEELEVDMIEKAKERAQELMKQAVIKDEEGFAAASAALERELARYKVAIRHRTRTQSAPRIDQARIKHKDNVQ